MNECRAVDAVAQPRWQNLLQFQKRAHRGFLDSGDAATGGSSQPERDRDGFLVIEQQRRQHCARAQLVASSGSRGGVHRISQAAQAVDVAAEGTRGYVEPPGKVGAGPIALSLKKGQQAEQPS